MLKSGFDFYSVGIVAEDKEEYKHDVEIYPIELLNRYNGNIAEIEIIVKEIKNELDETTNISVEKRMTLHCKWLPVSQSNRCTSPHVYKGETIMIYRFGDTDQYFWDTIYDEPDLRRNEYVKHRISNEPEFKVGLDDDNTYWFKWDSINKILQLHTSDNDEELTTYDIRIDTKEGILKITDGRDNHLTLFSAEDCLDVNMNKKITINAPDLVFNTNTTIFNCDTGFAIKSPNTLMSENVFIGADLGIVGDSYATDHISGGGAEPGEANDTSCGSKSTITPGVCLPGISFMEHVHEGVMSGAAATTTPV